MATRAAAPPPTPLKEATICGMAVIFTDRAATNATGVPIKMATAIRTRLSAEWCSSGTVVKKAITIPRAASRLPERACRGELSWWRPNMNRTAASR